MHPSVEDPIREPRAEDAPPLTPACSLTREQAGERAMAGLATLAAAEVPPPGFVLRTPCASHCLRRGESAEANDVCPSWQCDIDYGASRTWQGYLPITMYVARCGERVFTGMRLEGCFRKPHRCAFTVDRVEALRLAGTTPDADEMEMVWDPESEEFMWVVARDGRMLREGSVRISAHVPARTPPRR